MARGENTGDHDGRKVPRDKFMDIMNANGMGNVKPAAKVDSGAEWDYVNEAKAWEAAQGPVRDQNLREAMDRMQRRRDGY